MGIVFLAQDLRLLPQLLIIQLIQLPLQQIIQLLLKIPIRKMKMLQMRIRVQMQVIKTTTPVASNETPEKTDPPAKEVQQPATTPKENVANNTATPANTTSTPVTSPVAEAETTIQPETNTPQVVPQNTTSEDELQRAKTMADAYKAVQDSGNRSTKRTDGAEKAGT